MVALLTEGVDRNADKGNAFVGGNRVALLTEGVDRNSLTWALEQYQQASPSSRRAWIEIPVKPTCRPLSTRRPPRGGHGWKCKPQLAFPAGQIVALLAEGVDRNGKGGLNVGGIAKSPSSRRAWIEMIFCSGRDAARARSPSSRRAWIEIEIKQLNAQFGSSPSSRRAWIEIPCPS